MREVSTEFFTRFMFDPEFGNFEFWAPSGDKNISKMCLLIIKEKTP